ncbi:MAG: hypothetical protein AAGD22_07905 [Verrucomicrobiota bacterium]
MAHSRGATPIRNIVIIGLLLVAGLAFLRIGRERLNDPAPLTPRAAAIQSMTEPRKADAQSLLAWSRRNTPILSINSPVDALPNGLAMAMAPFLVDWEKSQLEGKPDDFYLVHNVVVGGNQVRGTVLLGTVRVPANGVESVEWNLVISRVKGRDTPRGHAQLRFIFKKDALPVVLDQNGNALHDNAEIDDLVFSWEAWRPPGTRWGMIPGLDPETFALTVRCYDGAERFLNDAVFGHAWACYPLDLPSVPGAERDQLHTCMILGDALARRTAQAILDEDSEYDTGFQPEEIAHEMAKLRQQFSKDSMPDEPLIYHAGNKDLSYHLLLRSCITQALAAVDLGMEKTFYENDLGERPSLRYIPETLPDWICDLAHGRNTENRPSLLAKIGPTIRWLTENSQVIPGNAYRILDEGGLLQHDDKDNLVRFYYRVDLTTPYGAVPINVAY